MGRIILKSALMSKTQNLIDSATDRQQNVYEVMTALNDFASDSVLTGEAYKNAKGFISRVYIPICKALCMALEDEITANRKVLSCCNTYLQGTDRFDENAINAEVERLKAEFRKLSDPGNLILGMNLPAAAAINADRIAFCLWRIRRLEHYLEELDRFDKATKNLHNSAATQMNTVCKKIDSIFSPALFSNGKFDYSRVDMSWAAELAKRWDDSWGAMTVKFKNLENPTQKKVSNLLSLIFDDFKSAPKVLELLAYLNRQKPLCWLFFRATREGWLDEIFDKCSFDRSNKDGCFHVNTNEYQQSLLKQLTKDKDGVCIQQFGGYADAYDFVFDVFCNMDANKIQFSTGAGKAYTLWMWKGDYLNLGAGGELGIYEGEGRIVDCAVNDKLKMSVHVDYGDGTSTDWSDKTWWITTFNPEKQNACADNITMEYMLDFSDADSQMWKAFVAKCKEEKYKNIVLDRKGKKAVIVF